MPHAIVAPLFEPIVCARLLQPPPPPLRVILLLRSPPAPLPPTPLRIFRHQHRVYFNPTSTAPPPHPPHQGITLEEHRRQLEALRLAVQAEAAPAPARAIKEDLSGLKVIAKEDGAFVAPVEKAKSKKDRSQNKAVLDVADLFAAGPADAARTPRGGDRPARGGSEGLRTCTPLSITNCDTYTPSTRFLPWRPRRQRLWPWWTWRPRWQQRWSCRQRRRLPGTWKPLGARLSLSPSA
jgi:hypothetical protein